MADTTVEIEGLVGVDTIECGVAGFKGETSEWTHAFLQALSGTASNGSGSARDVVAQAERIADEADRLVSQRAKRRAEEREVKRKAKVEEILHTRMYCNKHSGQTIEAVRVDSELVYFGGRGGFCELVDFDDLYEPAGDREVIPPPPPSPQPLTRRDRP